MDISTSIPIRLISERHGSRAYLNDQLQNQILKKESLQNAYIRDPLSPYAPIAYFYFHTSREYMHGSRKTLKHLQSMPLLFPTHPLPYPGTLFDGFEPKKGPSFRGWTNRASQGFDSSDRSLSICRK